MLWIDVYKRQEKWLEAACEMFPQLDLSGMDNVSLNMDTLEAIYTKRSIRKYTEKSAF